MSLTVLELCSRFLYRINEPLPASFSLVTGADPGALQVKHILIQVCEELRQARCFPQQKKTYQFTSTSGSRVSYPLPKDFYSPLLDTEYNSTTHLPLYNGSDADFAYRLNVIASSNYITAFRIFGSDANPNTAGGQFNVNPALPSGQVGTYQYITKNLFLPPNWTPSTSIPALSYRNVNGVNLFTTAGGTTSTTPPTGAGIDGTVTWTLYDEAYETMLSDNDLCIFDDDLVILGLRARWYEIKRYDGYENFVNEFLSKIEQSVNRWKGTNRGSLTRYGTWNPRFRPATPGGWVY